MSGIPLEEVGVAVVNGSGQYWFFVSDPDKQSKKKSQSQEQEQEKEEKDILCRQCEARITSPIHRFEVQGDFEHTFLNPGGQVFRIGCFSSADGCLNLGVPTTDWTWFEGFEWQVAICKQCYVHLGWFYRSSGEKNFYGLILDSLI